MNKELINKIEQIEKQTINIKSILKDQTNHIGQYHKALKQITEQLVYIKEKLIILKGEVE
jgi:hypothetical protein